MRIPFLLLLVISLISCGKKTDNHQDHQVVLSGISSELDSLLTEENKEGRFNGTVLVGRGDSLLLTKAYGVADNSTKEPLNTTSVFYMGSLAKQFTSMSIMLLEADGKLSFDDPIITYLPELEKTVGGITIRQMMNHTSGLPDYYALGIFKEGMRNADVLKAMTEIDSLDFEPNAEYSYSNSAYVLLSIIAERVSGKSFGAFLNEKVFLPLNMLNTVVYDETKPEISHRVKGHNEDGSLNDYNAFTTGGGGIFSNVEDMYLWDRALYQDKVINQEKLQGAFTPAVLSNDSLSYYGFGWMLDKDFPGQVRHSGSLAGFRTYIFRDTKSKTVIILLSNFTNNASALTNKIRDVLAEKKE